MNSNELQKRHELAHALPKTKQSTNVKISELFASTITAESLIDRHSAVSNALKFDDDTPSGNDKVFGVRTHADFKQWGDSLEAELAKRNIPFTNIPW